MQDRSYGIIPLRIKEGGWEVFLVKHQMGHWAFPKGHADREESPEQTAKRELHEETGLSAVSLLPQKKYQEKYRYVLEDTAIDKIVIYFPALVEGEPLLQRGEVVEGMWISLENAITQLTFDESKEICRQILQDIGHMNNHGATYDK